MFCRTSCRRERKFVGLGAGFLFDGGSLLGVFGDVVRLSIFIGSCENLFKSEGFHSELLHQSGLTT